LRSVVGPVKTSYYRRDGRLSVTSVTWLPVVLARTSKEMNSVLNVSCRRGARYPQAMKPRDVIISFQCSSPDLVQVSETVGSTNIQCQLVQRHPDVVTELEKKYIFFADEADLARKLLGRGCSCVLSVYFREP
jgi:hypothetical protein